MPIELILSWWAVASLTTLLMWIWAGRVSGDKPKDHDNATWAVLFMISVLFPFGIVMLIIALISIHSDILTREW